MTDPQPFRLKKVKFIGGVLVEKQRQFLFVMALTQGLIICRLSTKLKKPKLNAFVDVQAQVTNLFVTAPTSLSLVVAGMRIMTGIRSKTLSKRA